MNLGQLSRLRVSRCCHGGCSSVPARCGRSRGLNNGLQLLVNPDRIRRPFLVPSDFPGSRAVRPRRGRLGAGGDPAPGARRPDARPRRHAGAGFSGFSPSRPRRHAADGRPGQRDHLRRRPQRRYRPPSARADRRGTRSGVGKDLYVYLSEVMPYVASGVLDKRLFDVTLLIERGAFHHCAGVAGSDRLGGGQRRARRRDREDLAGREGEGKVGAEHRVDRRPGRLAGRLRRQGCRRRDPEYRDRHGSSGPTLAYLASFR